MIKLLIKKGKDRWVLVFPKINLAVKIARVKFWEAICTCYCAIEYPKMAKTIFKFKDYDRRQINFFRSLFGGLTANLIEFFYSIKSNNNFIQKTYFTLFGFVNFQRADRELERSFWFEIQEIVSEEIAYRDSHHFASKSNFSVRSGKVKIHDYGSKVCCQIIEEFKEKLSELKE